MIKYFLCCFMLCGVLSAQNDTIINKDTIKDSRYLEDQIYIGLSYILMNKLPDSISSNGFSNSLVLGFIKDIPLNERRNLALGVGLGYGRHTYYQNLKITRPDEITQFEVGDGFKSNKFSLHAVEVPIEFRWRTSTIDKYKFYRIYFGGKISYAFATNSKFRGSDNTVKINRIDELNKLQYGLSLSMGYGTWNLNIYYGLSDLFSKANLNDTTPIKIKEFRVGLIFYIL
ncbi:porin family protein [Aureibaculum sp. 2210JD6-5]|uniref:porin family protein n=1 Tax=Aureibaculum sp. 2210JD6-5 TaxID=3103957 RepID=UPI002AAC9BF8|nr:porin family protein [Aureibaculum sp. 2210JD6-5]MDY7396016.1 porin family protein [Aureibaculum sp. 2210JD6-5]